MGGLINLVCVGRTRASYPCLFFLADGRFDQFGLPQPSPLKRIDFKCTTGSTFFPGHTWTIFAGFVETFAVQYPDTIGP